MLSVILNHQNIFQFTQIKPCTDLKVGEIPSQSKQLEWNDLEQKQKNHTSLIIKAINSMQQSPLNKVVLATALECTDCQNHQLIILNDPIAIQKHFQLSAFIPNMACGWAQPLNA